MPLSSDLISQFVRMTKQEKQKKESIVYGTIKSSDGKQYVQLDGSVFLTPFYTTTDVADEERVVVMIKDHTAVVTGNVSSPSARRKEVKAISQEVNDKINTEQFEAEIVRINNLVSDNVAINAKLTTVEVAIENLKNNKLDISVAENTYAKISDLEIINAEFSSLEANVTKINTLIFGSDSGGTIQTSFANAVIAKLGDAQIKSDMVDSISASKINYGNGEQKILWGKELISGISMTAEQTINLAEAVSAQPYGIVLVFSAYESESDTNYSWESFFVPKQLVTLSTSGHTFILGRGKFTYIGTKYLYIKDTSIAGHDDNELTGSNNGITYANNKFVLRYVIGV